MLHQTVMAFVVAGENVDYVGVEYIAVLRLREYRII